MKEKVNAGLPFAAPTTVLVDVGLFTSWNIKSLGSSRIAVTYRR
jgi:hypothetical protein